MKEPAGVKPCARGRFQCRSWFCSQLFKEVVIFKNKRRTCCVKGGLHEHISPVFVYSQTYIRGVIDTLKIYYFASTGQ
jgi:hypothetical protein